MKQTTQHTKDVWDSGDFAGESRRPTARVTIQKFVSRHPQYRLDESRSRQWEHWGVYGCFMFGQEEQRPRELANVVSVKWSRGVDTDVGEATIVLANVEIRNDNDPQADELDYPGYYTPNRGSYVDEWGYVKNEWREWLQPDRIVRTYEGYGADRGVAPEVDSHMYPSGVWLIDDVSLTAEGEITLQCRDVGRALLDQVAFPPLIPYGAYPLWFAPHEDRGKPQKVVAPSGDLDWVSPTYDSDSNIAYIGSGILEKNGKPIVASDGSVGGRRGSHAFDGLTATYWRSCGKRDRADSDAVEWIQGTIPSRAVDGVKIDARGGPYRVYVSLRNASGWLGRKRIPYRARNVDTGANLRYVEEFTIRGGETLTHALNRRYTGITKIRFSFASLPWTPAGSRFNYRAAIEQVYYANNVSLQSAPGTFKFGNYSDYTAIVKWLLAWGGWFWPGAESGLNTLTYSDGSKATIAPSSHDPALVGGRVWGDFEQTGTTAVKDTKLDVDVFDKKPLMDGINAVRETVGFDFWIDETGGAIWRMPNIFEKGCYVMPVKGGPRTTRTSTLVRIDEAKHLIDLEVKLSSRNVRERIYVANIGGNKGAVVRGFKPDHTGLRRYAGWTDHRFASSDECERMADLIALKQSFLYRQDSLTIAANPALQPDDQVIVVERMTGEGYIHRILNIASDFDNETGRWTYTLTTNWLGSQAFTNLAWDPKYLRDKTKVYLRNMGKPV